MAKDKIKNETKTLAEIKAENETLYQQLTNKNQDYMFQLNSRLEELDYDTTKKEYVFNEMLHEIIAAQGGSITARRTYGTVREQADNILGKNVDMDGENSNRSPEKLIYLDGALLMGGFFNLINGFAALRSTEAAAQVGIIQVILNFLLGGLAVMFLTRFIPEPGATKGFFKYAAATFVIIIGWVLLMALILTILNPINFIIPATVVMGIGAVSLVAKWYVKNKLNIKGTII